MLGISIKDRIHNPIIFTSIHGLRTYQTKYCVKVAFDELCSVAVVVTALSHELGDTEFYYRFGYTERLTFLL